MRKGDVYIGGGYVLRRCEACSETFLAGAKSQQDRCPEHRRGARRRGRVLDASAYMELPAGRRLLRVRPGS